MEENEEIIEGGAEIVRTEQLCEEGEE